MKRLTRNVTGHNYTVYCDNFFTSATLFCDLLQDKIYNVCIVVHIMQHVNAIIMI